MKGSFLIEIPIGKVREASRPILREDGSVDISAIDFSAAEMWMRCGKQFKFRYVEGKKSPPGVALAEGISHHKSMEMDNAFKINRNKSLSHRELTEIFVNNFRDIIPKYERECDEFKITLDWEDDDESTIIKRARIFHAHYEKSFSPKIKPELVEEKFFKPVVIDDKEEFKLFGQVDVATKKKLIDYKVTGRPKSARDAKDSLQLSIYSWATQKRDTSFINFVKAKSPYVQEVGATKTPGDWIWALEVIGQAVKSIRLGSFPLTRPDPMNWWCSPKFCGYYKDCRGKTV